MATQQDVMNFIYTPDIENQTHRECRASFASDRAHGAIYGAYAVHFAGKARACNAALFAAHSGECVYCRGPLHVLTLRTLRSKVARYLRRSRLFDRAARAVKVRRDAFDTFSTC